MKLTQIIKPILVNKNNNSGYIVVIFKKSRKNKKRLVAIICYNIVVQFDRLKNTESSDMGYFRHY